jgi:hypothetical protein
MTRLVAAIGIVSALVLAGGITAGLILAKDQAPPAPVPMASEAVVPAPDAAAETGPVAVLETGQLPPRLRRNLNSRLCLSRDPRLPL